jgi:hypothetical protein
MLQAGGEHAAFRVGHVLHGACGEATGGRQGVLPHVNVHVNGLPVDPHGVITQQLCQGGFAGVGATDNHYAGAVDGGCKKKSKDGSQQTRTKL